MGIASARGAVVSRVVEEPEEGWGATPGWELGIIERRPKCLAHEVTRLRRGSQPSGVQLGFYRNVCMTWSARPDGKPSILMA